MEIIMLDAANDQVTMMPELVILVDEDDVAIGYDEKLAVHRSGALHRAFSVIVFNSHGEMLMQQRALTKYHSGGLWSNTCCGHPRPEESTIAAAHRRLREEMSITCELVHEGSFMYHARLNAELIEHEYDHVVVGFCDGSPAPDADEVMDWRWIEFQRALASVAAQPEIYTAWLPLVLARVTGDAARIHRESSVPAATV